MDILKNIIRIRESKGIKQYEIAEKLEMEAPNYSRLEKRGDKLTIEQLKKIAEAMGVSYTDFINVPDLKNINQDNSKRINELENWLIDKEEIIKHYKYIANYSDNRIDKILEIIKLEVAFKLNLLKVITSNNETIEINTEENFKTFKEQELIAFNEEYIDQIMEHIQSDRFLDTIVCNLLVAKGLSEIPKDWRKHYHDFQKSNILSSTRVFLNHKELNGQEKVDYLNENFERMTKDLKK